VVGDDHTTSTHRGLTNEVGVVGETRKNGLDNATEVRREAISERDGKEYE
jgi:hypothetical protein